MITTRKAADRGHFDFGWLDTRHTFSFGEYADPRHMGFGPLRVINEDRVRAGEGFGTHGHRDMEILTWVLSGALEHKDSLGSVGVLKPGIAQRMSAGTGIRHSEYNHSPTEDVHFLQIWIVPAVRGAEPRYEDREFPSEGRRDRLQLLASPDAADGSLSLHQDARVYVAALGGGEGGCPCPGAGPQGLGAGRPRRGLPARRGRQRNADGPGRRRRGVPRRRAGPRPPGGIPGRDPPLRPPLRTGRPRPERPRHSVIVAARPEN